MSMEDRYSPVDELSRGASAAGTLDGGSTAMVDLPSAVASVAAPLSLLTPGERPLGPAAPPSSVALGKKPAASTEGATPVTQGLRALADAVRPKKKRGVVKANDPRGVGPSTNAAAAKPASPGAVSRGAGKRPVETSVPVSVAKRSRIGSLRSKAGDRGKAAAPLVKEN
ncbi:unnamed protein product [Linum trigynum]|uniref:Uncharacterized protein n=1 Tax=Linum trigynum TaxID=586398 RepID=A0AAV2GNA6_9ROSI